MTTDYYSRTLKHSGLLAELVKHDGPPEQWALIIDGSLHSSVDVANPSDLYFHYSNKVGSIIETLFPSSSALSVLHLGAGALSIARYVEATRPGSVQVAVELEEDLVEFVESAIPIPNREMLDVLIGDAREVVEAKAEEFSRKFDLIVVEIFLERSTPAHVTSLEFYALLEKCLAPGGAVIVNIIDGDPYEFACNQFVTIKQAFGGAKAVIDKEDFISEVSSNVLIVGSSSDVLELLSDFSLLTPRPAEIVQGPLADTWQKKGSVVYDVSSSSWETKNRWLSEIGTLKKVGS